MGAEEERAMATTIASAKATDMATVTEMEMLTATAKGNGTLTAMATATATKTAKYTEIVKGTVLETDMGRGRVGEGWQIIPFNFNMHLSTIILTSIIVKQQLNYPNIKSMLSSFKATSLR
jgi:hypothetical protein